ncbi:disabled homolog 2-like [Mastacembelus armatus]|uniref:Disabled homolog 2-like n=1 Tax=Mastacembelus armatus TaxID=205130 RepID=A0A7N8XTH4_9TELE|nr:disabled homolog 2-like [Mastacembelus armatus]XP_026179313.1 disabled homolog 2-like [Mastacembelus armatus]
MMETAQTAGSCPAQSQAAVRTWLSSSTRGTNRTPSDSTSRFQGDGVRYKAKLIGVDPVPEAQGEKMCWDSMMKLKGFEAAARKQGKHKQRVWLKVSSTGLKIVDERTGAVHHDHDRSRISSLMKDESDPRALAYIYQHQDTYSLFYIKMANLAEPVLVDINEVCQSVDQETPQESAEAPTQNGSLLLLHEVSATSTEGPALEDVFSPDSSCGQANQGSSSNELMDVFSTQLEEPLSPTQSSCQPESPPPMLSTSQILSMFPMQPVGGSPYSRPPYSPAAIPLGQQGFQGTQWAGPAMAPWPNMPSPMAAWAPVGITAPPAGIQPQAHSSHPGMMWGGTSPSSPTAVNGYPTPFNSGALQSASPSLDKHNPLL